MKLLVMNALRKINLAHKCLKNISSITKFEKREENGNKRKRKDSYKYSSLQKIKSRLNLVLFFDSNYNLQV